MSRALLRWGIMLWVFSSALSGGLVLYRVLLCPRFPSAYSMVNPSGSRSCICRSNPRSRGALCTGTPRAMKSSYSPSRSSVLISTWTNARSFLPPPAVSRDTPGPSSSGPTRQCRVRPAAASGIALPGHRDRAPALAPTIGTTPTSRRTPPAPQREPDASSLHQVPAIRTLGPNNADDSRSHVPCGHQVTGDSLREVQPERTAARATAPPQRTVEESR